jgi:hypothetical protein
MLVIGLIVALLLLLPGVLSGIARTVSLLRAWLRARRQNDGLATSLRGHVSAQQHGDLEAEPLADWFYADGPNHRGPYGVDVLRDLMTRGLITGETPVWTKSFGQAWKTAREAGIFASAPPELSPRDDSPPVQKRRRRWVGPLLVGIIFFWLVGGFVWLLEWSGVDVETAMSKELPKCGSITTKDLARQALEGAPVAKVLNVKVFEILDPVQLSYDGVSDKRNCKAAALMNSGKRDITFTLEWIDKSNAKVWLQIDALPF